VVKSSFPLPRCGSLGGRRKQRAVVEAAGVKIALIGSFLVAALPSPVAPPPPGPSPSPELREIGHVRTTALCTMLRDGVVPAVAGLAKNDELIDAGHRGFSKMARDVSDSSSAGAAMDKMYLGQIQTRLVRNLKTLEALLGDRARFPDDPGSAAAADTNSMKSELKAVADSQREALALLSGVVETEAQGQMQHEMSDQMSSVTGRPGPAPFGRATDAPVSFLGSAGLPEDPPATGLPTLAPNMSTLGGHTVYDTILAALESRQLTIAHREQSVSTSVIAAVRACRAGVAPQEAPAPAPSSP
jgi:hypothetical protein